MELPIDLMRTASEEASNSHPSHHLASSTASMKEIPVDPLSLVIADRHVSSDSEEEEEDFMDDDDDDNELEEVAQVGDDDDGNPDSPVQSE